MFNIINRLSIEFTKNCNFSCTYCHQEHSEGYLDFDSLIRRVEFINKLDILNPNIVDIAFTGGEVTIDGNRLTKYFIYLEKNIKVRCKDFTLMSNMSNIPLVLKLLDNGLLRRDRVGFSWDGFENGKTRKSKYDDKFFIEALNYLASTQYKDDVFIQIALTPETLPKLYNTIKFLHNIGLTNLGTYLVTGVKYSKDDELIYDKQLEEISKLFINSYINDKERLRLYTFLKCYRDYVLRKDIDMEETIRCGKLGKAIHISMDGFLYPCIYFGDHDLFRIGDLKNGLDKNALCKFKDEYYSKPKCINDCNVRHCCSCPADCYRKRGGLNNKNLNYCNMQKIEQKWFYNIINYLMPYITDFALKTYWGRVHDEPA